MTKRPEPRETAERHVKDIRRKTRRKFSSEDKIRIVLEGLRGEYSIAELCRREGIAESLYYNWSKDFLAAGKRRLSGDTARQATSGEVTSLKREARDLKEALANIDLSASTASLPIKFAKTKVNDAANLIASGKFYEANLALITLEDSVVIDAVSVDAAPASDKD